MYGPAKSIALNLGKLSPPGLEGLRLGNSKATDAPPHECDDAIEETIGRVANSIIRVSLCHPEGFVHLTMGVAMCDPDVAIDKYFLTAIVCDRGHRLCFLQSSQRLTRFRENLGK